MLSRLDALFQIAAALILLAVIVTWVARRCPNPLEKAPPRPNRFREDAVMLPVLAYFLTVVLAAGILGLLGEVKPASPPALFAALLAQLAGTAACLVLAAQQFEGGIRAFLLGRARNRLPELGMHPETPSPGPLPQRGRGVWGCTLSAARTLTVVIVALGLCPVILEQTVRAFHYFRPDYELSVHSTIEMLHDETQPFFIIVTLWVGAAFVAPLAEELFFRGILQTVLLSLTGRRTVAMGAAALAFALAHTQQPHTIPALLGLGVLLGFVYERSGSLVPCILIHAVFNLKTLTWDALNQA